MSEYTKPITFETTPNFIRKTRKVYPYSMVLNEVGSTPINAVQVSENLNMRRSDAQRYLNKARNERYVSLYPEEHTKKMSSIFDGSSKAEINNNKCYTKF
jgi:myo-inositol-1-phosphate synthase